MVMVVRLWPALCFTHPSNPRSWVHGVDGGDGVKPWPGCASARVTAFLRLPPMISLRNRRQRDASRGGGAGGFGGGVAEGAQGGGVPRATARPARLGRDRRAGAVAGQRGLDHRVVLGREMGERPLAA